MPGWRQYNKSGGDVNWSLPLSSVYDWWKPTLAGIRKGNSVVVSVVADTLLEDSPNLLRADQVILPSDENDLIRSLQCFEWLSQLAIPAWVLYWADNCAHHRNHEIQIMAEEIKEHAGSLTSLG